MRLSCKEIIPTLLLNCEVLCAKRIFDCYVLFRRKWRNRMTISYGWKKFDNPCSIGSSAQALISTLQSTCWLCTLLWKTPATFMREKWFAHREWRAMECDKSQNGKADGTRWLLIINQILMGDWAILPDVSIFFWTVVFQGCDFLKESWFLVMNGVF